MPIYQFCTPDDPDSDLLLETGAKIKTMHRLLDKYREQDDLSLGEFLESKGYKVRFLSPDYTLEY